MLKGAVGQEEREGTGKSNEEPKEMPLNQMESKNRRHKCKSGSRERFKTTEARRTVRTRHAQKPTLSVCLSAFSSLVCLPVQKSPVKGDMAHVHNG